MAIDIDNLIGNSSEEELVKLLEACIENVTDQVLIDALKLKTTPECKEGIILAMQEVLEDEEDTQDEDDDLDLED